LILHKGGGGHVHKVRRGDHGQGVAQPRAIAMANEQMNCSSVPFTPDIRARPSNVLPEPTNRYRCRPPSSLDVAKYGWSRPQSRCLGIRPQVNDSPPRTIKGYPREDGSVDRKGSNLLESRGAREVKKLENSQSLKLIRGGR
jgi:hypothetical protein